MTDEERKKTFLGFDFSTQRLKALVIGEDYGVLHEADVEFDVDLPEFRTAGGVQRGQQRGEVTAPPLLWVKALDMVMDRLVVSGVDFSTIEALSGAAQQHGSVWWSKEAEAKLGSLSPDDFLHTQLATAFVTDSPVWMDSSTSADCRALEEAVGGAEELARMTGSTAYERFTGAQIRKMRRCRPRAYSAAARVSLVSSFACSLLLGRIAPIDYSDGSGMNLLDIHEMKWNEKALKACGDDTLEAKLGTPVPTATVLGQISPYFVQRYGFRPDCKVVAFTGDNCSALAGLRLRSGWVGLSLGTSDTLLLGLRAPAAPPAGHVLLGPTPAAPYMALLCFANGSLTRQRHRDRLAEGSWEAFNHLLRATVRGNMGYMGIYYDTAEIVPRVGAGRWVRDAGGRALQRLAPQFEARALLEGQAIARRAHAEDMGFRLDSSSRVIATGGAAVNKELLQIFADVFNTPVYVQNEHGNAALLGAAIRAADVWSADAGISLPGAEPTVTPVATPYPDHDEIYPPMISRYRQIIETLPKLA
ncbi:xylulose kinase [Plodia interpunctella]|uniref:xylulose kinase n=1 Tax=Plodia interpunctella TaxID=58824 RepID=UPI0023676960|nr:xylulose kinase [Plodia interpunctella]